MSQLAHNSGDLSPHQHLERKTFLTHQNQSQSQSQTSSLTQHQNQSQAMAQSIQIQNQNQSHIQGHSHSQQQEPKHQLQHLNQLQHQSHTHNSSSNASTPNSNTSFLIKDILRYEGQKRKQRKARTAFSDHQLKELEASFEAKKYLTVQDRVELAAKLKLSDTQVKTWYQNRRTKHKRQTAVGLELLTEAGNILAYQSVYERSSNWLLGHFPGHYANAGAQFNMLTTLLAAQNQAQVQAQAQAQAASQLGADNNK